MTEHLKAYLVFHNLSDADEVVCEITGRPAHLGGVDISHNLGRGMGGSKTKNTKENLMALCRPLHTFLENNPKYYWWFHLVHCAFLATKQVYIETKCSIEDPIWEDIKSNYT